MNRVTFSVPTVVGNFSADVDVSSYGKDRALILSGGLAITDVIHLYGAGASSAAAADYAFVKEIRGGSAAQILRFEDLSLHYKVKRVSGTAAATMYGSFVNDASGGAQGDSRIILGPKLFAAVASAADTFAHKTLYRITSAGNEILSEIYAIPRTTQAGDSNNYAAFTFNWIDEANAVQNGGPAAILNLGTNAGGGTWTAQVPKSAELQGAPIGQISWRLDMVKTQVGTGSAAPEFDLVLVLVKSAG